jgi:hypothetical protein
MSYKPRTYTVRGFDVNSVSDIFSKPTGTIDQFSSFTETVVRNQFEAIALMLTAYRSMSAYDLKKAPSINCTASVNTGQVPSDEANQQIFVIDFSIVLKTNNKTSVKLLKPKIMSTLKTWAEKSRVKGLRGWRISAIKTPTYEYCNDTSETIVRTQVILSNAIIYSNMGNYQVDCDISPRGHEILDDLAKFKKQLEREKVGTFLETIYFKHSLIGKGEIL